MIMETCADFIMENFGIKLGETKRKSNFVAPPRTDIYTNDDKISHLSWCCFEVYERPQNVMFLFVICQL